MMFSAGNINLPLIYVLVKRIFREIYINKQL